MEVWEIPCTYCRGLCKDHSFRSDNNSSVQNFHMFCSLDTACLRLLSTVILRVRGLSRDLEQCPSLRYVSFSISDRGRLDLGHGKRSETSCQRGGCVLRRPCSPRCRVLFARRPIKLIRRDADLNQALRRHYGYVKARHKGIISACPPKKILSHVSD